MKVWGTELYSTYKATLVCDTHESNHEANVVATIVTVLPHDGRTDGFGLGTAPP